MTKKDDKTSGLVEAFLGGPSEAGIREQRKHEIRLGRPDLTEAEAELMFQASLKNNNYPPPSLAHPKEMLGIETPKRLSRPSGETLKTLWLIGIALAEGMKQGPAKAAELANLVAERREREANEQEAKERGSEEDESPSKTKPTPDYSANSEWGRDDRETEQPLGAIARAVKQLAAERKAREAKEQEEREAKAAPPSADALEWKVHRGGLPGVMALVLSRTLRQVAGNDRHMAQWAADVEKRARAVILIYLSRMDQHDTAH